jgi:hypothetical protein
MNRSLLQSIGCGLATTLVGCWPMVASAQVGRGDDMTVDHVRSEFISAGLHASAVATANWRSRDAANTPCTICDAESSGGARSKKHLRICDGLSAFLIPKGAHRAQIWA